MLKELSNKTKVIAKQIILGNLERSEYSQLLAKFLSNYFESSSDFEEGLLFLSCIVSTYPVYNHSFFEILEITVSGVFSLSNSFLNLFSKTLKKLSKNQDKNTQTIKNIQKTSILSDSFLLLFIKFLKNQFYNSILNKTTGYIPIGRIFEYLISLDI